MLDSRQNPVPKLSILNAVIGKLPLTGGYFLAVLQKLLSIIFLRFSVKAIMKGTKNERGKPIPNEASRDYFTVPSGFGRTMRTTGDAADESRLDGLFSPKCFVGTGERSCTEAFLFGSMLGNLDHASQKNMQLIV